jgi:hypothetical protein
MTRQRTVTLSRVEYESMREAFEYCRDILKREARAAVRQYSEIEDSPSVELVAHFEVKKETRLKRLTAFESIWRLFP